MLSVVPVWAVSSFRTTTCGNDMSTVAIVSGQRAAAVSPPAATTGVAHAVRPSAHNAAAGSHPRYRPGAGGSRYAAVSATKARTLHAGSAGSVSGTSGTLAPQGRTRRSDAPGAACTLRSTPSPAGRASVPVGMKLVVSIHAARPGGGRKRGAMRAVTTRSEEHTSELQSHSDLVCRLLLEKKKKK